MPAGRPSSYDPKKTPKRAKRACLLGATDADLGVIFGVSEATINNWKIEHPKFLESLNAGKHEADERVTKSLYQRANGYSHKDVHISNYQGEITLTPVVKHFPPDTTAAIFWLKNRQSGKWRDRKEHEISDPGGEAFGSGASHMVANLLTSALAKRDAEQDDDGDLA